MNNINLDLQLFDRFITESENHMTMIRDHYNKLSKGYLTESVEFQLIQESEQSTLKDKIIKILEAIKNFFINIFKKIIEKFKGKKKKLESIISGLDPKTGLKVDLNSDKKERVTHAKFDISKISYNRLSMSTNIFHMKILDLIIKHIEPSNKLTYELDEIVSNTIESMLKGSLGIHGFKDSIKMENLKKVVIDNNNKVTKEYTASDIIVISKELLRLNEEISDMNTKISREAIKFIDSIKTTAKQSGSQSLMIIVDQIINRVNSVLKVELEIANTINTSYSEICDIISTIFNKFVVDNKQESFTPPLDASFESLLETINPVHVKLLDL